MDFERRCWVEVDLDIIEENFKAINRISENIPVMAVVKADAYGHGDIEIAKTLSDAGASAFAVSGLYEGMRLRRAGITKPILILGYTSPKSVKDLYENHLTQSLIGSDYAKELSIAATQENVTVTVHVAVDTGMGRIGFDAKKNAIQCADEIASAIRLPGIAATGIFTHFSVADSIDENDIEYTRQQYELLEKTVNSLEKENLVFATCHCCNSAAIIRQKENYPDMIRAGIILYGYAPSDEVGFDLVRPAMKLKTTVTLVKEIEPGEYLSYGRKFCADKKMRIATLSIGYADGYLRALSSKGIVSVNGYAAPILGTVCMDQCMIDVTDIPCKQGDVVTVYNGENGDSIEDVAHKVGTISYEIICDIGRRVQRVYTRNNKEINVVNYIL